MFEVLILVVINLFWGFFWYRIGKIIEKRDYRKVCIRAIKMAFTEQRNLDVKTVKDSFEKLYEWSCRPDITKEDIVTGLKVHYEKYAGDSALNEAEEILKSIEKKPSS